MYHVLSKPAYQSQVRVTSVPAPSRSKLSDTSAPVWYKVLVPETAEEERVMAQHDYCWLVTAVRQAA